MIWTQLSRSYVFVMLPRFCLLVVVGIPAVVGLKFVVFVIWANISSSLVCSANMLVKSRLRQLLSARMMTAVFIIIWRIAISLMRLHHAHTKNKNFYRLNVCISYALLEKLQGQSFQVQSIDVKICQADKICHGTEEPCAVHSSLLNRAQTWRPTRLAWPIWPNAVLKGSSLIVWSQLNTSWYCDLIRAWTSSYFVLNFIVEIFSRYCPKYMP